MEEGLERFLEQVIVESRKSECMEKAVKVLTVIKMVTGKVVSSKKLKWTVRRLVESKVSEAGKNAILQNPINVSSWPPSMSFTPGSYLFPIKIWSNTLCWKGEEEIPDLRKEASVQMKSRRIKPVRKYARIKKEWQFWTCCRMNHR